MGRVKPTLWRSRVVAVSRPFHPQLWGESGRSLTAKSNNQAPRLLYPRLERGLRWTLVFLLLALLTPTAKAAARPSRPEFALDSVLFTVRCTGPDSPASAIITWTTASEAGVSGFRVHRTALTEPAENRWVNYYPLAATGAGSQYRIIDGAILPGTTYRYRLYGFEESNRLSLATWVVMAERMRPSCVFLPLLGVGRYNRSFFG